MRLVVLCACWLWACTPAPTPSDPDVPAAVADPVEILGDVQHLLGQAVAESTAHNRGEAERLWLAAVALMDVHLLGHVRAQDPAQALALEYALGRMGAALRGEAGRPTRQYKPLDTALADLRPMFVAIRDAKAEVAEGGSAQEAAEAVPPAQP